MLPEKMYQTDQPLLNTDFVPDVAYLRTILLSRAADLREGILFRQGRGAFCLPSAGHENMAAIAHALMPHDHIFCHYRDRALLLARGTPLLDIALGFFAKKGSSSEGRQLSSHFSDAERNIISCASPIASQCLPAAGMAWSIKLQKKSDVVVCCIGEAGMRQGEFYEAWCFAIQESLPIIFVIEDNGYGISTPTEKHNPLKLGILTDQHIIKVNGRIAEQVYHSMDDATRRARGKLGPSILWISFDRLLSHTSSDDQRQYRSETELLECNQRDPINLLRDMLFAEDLLSAEEWDVLQQDANYEAAQIYLEAEGADEPDIQKLRQDTCALTPTILHTTKFLEDTAKLTMASAVNQTLRHLLTTHDKIMLFGQDIEDPKGGVFGLTKSLSTSYPAQVVNAPLAEATICGVAAGMALAGHTPIFELQFIDFMATGFNQIVNQIATMHWRTAGAYNCPLILLAPCGGYTHGGGPWHSQTNESMFAHVPGINIYMPSTATDAAQIILHCAAGRTPSLVLLPKKLFFKDSEELVPTTIHCNKASIIRQGNDATIVAWGNCVGLSSQAAERMQSDGISIEVIDLKSIIPCDLQTIKLSLKKTGRLIVVHEDNRTCGFGQSLIAEIVSDKTSWDLLYTAPKLVCRDDVLVPFNATLAAQILPSIEKIIDATISTLNK